MKKGREDKKFRDEFQLEKNLTSIKRGGKEVIKYVGLLIFE